MSFFAFLGSYVITSLVFFRYPNLLFRRKKVPFTCKHISHRGGAGECYENTLAAFHRAVSLGTDMLELDVHLTKDHHVVVSHDKNLLRCTGLDCDISNLKYCELPLLKESLTVDFDPEHVFCGSGLPNDRKLTLLEDVFRTFPEVPINIDIKVNDDNLIREVSRLINKYDRASRTVWGNFDYKITDKCYKENPKVNLLFSMRRVIHLLLLLYSGLLPFCPLKETHLEIFLPSVYHRNKSNSSKPNIKLQNLLVKTMDLIIMRPSLFAHLRKRGIQTYIWVLNYEDEFRTAFEKGVDGVMTDYPTRLKKFLEEHPEYTSNNCN